MKKNTANETRTIRGKTASSAPGTCTDKAVLGDDADTVCDTEELAASATRRLTATIRAPLKALASAERATETLVTMLWFLA
jgi:hypothetical protein